MNEPASRLRPPPLSRFAGPELWLDFEATIASLRREPHVGHDGHRQIAILHEPNLRLVLFAFEPGGHLAEHRAPGTVVIHALRGSLRIRTPYKTHELSGGTALILAPDVPHDVEAVGSADMLLVVAPTPTKSEGTAR